jgi:hypothetical protein
MLSRREQQEGMKHDDAIDATEFDFRLGSVETRQLLALMKGGHPPAKEHEGGSSDSYHFRRLEFQDVVRFFAYLKKWNYDSLEAVMEVMEEVMDDFSTIVSEFKGGGADSVNWCADEIDPNKNWLLPVAELVETVEDMLEEAGCEPLGAEGEGEYMLLMLAQVCESMSADGQRINARRLVRVAALDGFMVGKRERFLGQVLHSPYCTHHTVLTILYSPYTVLYTHHTLYCTHHTFLASSASC